MKQNNILKSACVLAVLSSWGCGDDDEDVGSGDLSVILESEDTVTGGLDPGDGVENIRDGWQVRFDKYIATVGDIEVEFATDHHVHDHEETAFVVDLKTVPESGLPLWSISDLRTGRWEFNYSTPGAGDGATRHESVSQADFDMMQANDLTYLINGTLSKADGKSCPPPNLAQPGTATAVGMNAAGQACYANPTITFNIALNAETHFGPCELDEVSGFAIANGSATTVAATIHGDHLFFNGFPDGDEGGVMRLAQWLADCDLNLDGMVTMQELESIKYEDLGEFDPTRYQTGGSPLPLAGMPVSVYVTAQLKTQGHMDGEGECPFDGMAHEH